MSESNIIDFKSSLANKQQKERLKADIAKKGWAIDHVSSTHSDLCVYIMDSTECGIILFGCGVDKFNISSNEIIHWGHFVLSWDVIADPSMPYDSTQKITVIELLVKALPGLKNWSEVSEKISNNNNEGKAHILIIVDRKDFEQPLDIIVARSNAVVLNSKSITAILREYLS